MPAFQHGADFTDGGAAYAQHAGDVGLGQFESVVVGPVVDRQEPPGQPLVEAMLGITSGGLLHLSEKALGKP